MRESQGEVVGRRKRADGQKERKQVEGLCLDDYGPRKKTEWGSGLIIHWYRYVDIVDLGASYSYSSS